jgi:hypothetical protein
MTSRRNTMAMSLIFFFCNRRRQSFLFHRSGKNHFAFKKAARIGNIYFFNSDFFMQIDISMFL